MLISELSEKTGLSKHTIRFYEKIGLIEAEQRQAGSRTYMEFSFEMIERIILITQGKSLGFTLTEMKKLISEWGNGTINTSEKLKIIDKKLDEIKNKMEQLEKIKIYLNTKRNKVINESTQSFSIQG